MADLLNSLEGGTNGTTVTSANTGGTSGNALDTVSIGAGSVLAFDNTHAAHGSLALKCTAAAATFSFGYWGTSLGAGQAQVWFRIYLYVTAAPAANARVVTFWNTTSAGTQCGALLINTAGKIIFQNAGSSTILTSAATFPLNTWFRVEGFLKASATVGQLEFKLFTTLDGTTTSDVQTSAATQNTGASVGSIGWGISNSPASAVGPYWIDDFGASVTAYLGPALTSFTGSSALSGSGTLGGAPGLAASSALSGSGTLGGAPVLTGAAGLTGTGTLGGSPAISVTPGPGLSGTGTLAAAPYVSAPGALSGSGTLSGPWTAGKQSAMTGSGTLAASPALSASAGLSGSGTLSGGPVRPGTSGMSGSGTLAAATAFTPAAVLSGSGTLSGSSAFAASVTLSGSGSLSGLWALSVQAALSGSGTLSAAGAPNATLTGSGTLAASPVLAGAPVLSGAGTLAAAPQLQAAGILTGAGTLAASPAMTAAAVLSGTGTLSGAPVKISPSALYNDLETIPGGSAPTTGNSAGPGDSPFDAISVGANAALTADSTHAAHGGQALKVSTGATATTALAEWTTSMGTQPTVWFRIYCYIPATPTPAWRAFSARSGASHAGSLLFSGTAMQLSAGAAFSTVATFTTHPPVGAWFRVEGFITGDAAAGVVSASIYTSMDSATPDETRTASGLNTVGQLTQYWFGQSNSVASSGPFWFDDIAISSAAPIGPVPGGVLSGSGTLGGAPAIQPAAAMSGSGTLGGMAQQPATATLSGTGTLGGTPAVTSHGDTGTSLWAAGIAAPRWHARPARCRWATRAAAPRWHATAASARWQAGPASPRWRIIMAEFEPIAAVSLEEINIAWTSDLDGTRIDPIAGNLTVQFAVPVSSGDETRPAQPASWFAASWLAGGTGKGYIAQGLVGPGGAVTLAAGQKYDVWSRITGSPEAPAKFAGVQAVY